MKCMNLVKYFIYDKSDIFHVIFMTVNSWIKCYVCTMCFPCHSLSLQ